MSSSEIVLEKIPSLLDSEKEEEAIELLSQLITSHPELAEAYLLRGNAYRQLRQWGPALSDYERVVALKPDCAAAHLYQGVVFGKRLNHQEALRCCNTALSLTPILQKPTTGVAEQTMSLDTICNHSQISMRRSDCSRRFLKRWHFDGPLKASAMNCGCCHQ
jgi:tetratricopeptide (TPR) repeat protein